MQGEFSGVYYKMVLTKTGQKRGWRKVTPDMEVGLSVLLGRPIPVLFSIDEEKVQRETSYTAGPPVCLSVSVSFGSD